MSLPVSVYLNAKVIAQWNIRNGANYNLLMQFNDPGDQGAIPTGQGLFYCTDMADPTDNNTWNGKYQGWLGSNYEPYPTQLIGNKLYSYLLLPISDNYINAITIGKSDGERPSGAGPFPDAGVLNYSYQNIEGSLSLPNGGNQGNIKVDTRPTQDATNYAGKNLIGLFNPSHPVGGQLKSDGVLVTPARQPKFEKNLFLHFFDSEGNLLGVLDNNCVGKSYWIPTPRFIGGLIFVVAAIGVSANNSNPNKKDFTIGDPRTNGSMTVSET